MDTFYNKAEAVNILIGEALEIIASTKRDALLNRKDRSVMHLADIDLASLCEGATDNDVKTEIVLRVQGILTKNNLVPQGVDSCLPAKAQYLSQHAEICGLDTSTFNDSVAKLEAINNVFAQHLMCAKFIPIAGVTGTSPFTMAASNRVFTWRSDLAATEQDNEFQNGVDPFRLLAKLKTVDLIHAPENIVKYFRRVAISDEPRKYEYNEFIPGGFIVGDIVEMQVCFVAMASGKSAVKITTRLQALTLLTNEYSKEAAVARHQATLSQTRSTAIRRKVGYYQEDEEDERKLKKRRTEDHDQGMD
ncbi:hypothetical protein B0H12DRAFT_1067550 [Mycena haematopus]|nr:hypothetical protein B0H12DRAFT_1067550 [Mycena haematopus]